VVQNCQHKKTKILLGSSRLIFFHMEIAYPKIFRQSIIEFLAIRTHKRSPASPRSLHWYNHRSSFRYRFRRHSLWQVSCFFYLKILSGSSGLQTKFQTICLIWCATEQLTSLWPRFRIQLIIINMTWHWRYQFILWVVFVDFFEAQIRLVGRSQKIV
jgi:hypothetical protein